MISSMWITQLYYIVLIICSFVIFAQSDVPRPRGVSLSKAPLYSPSKHFTCFDGTVTIPFNYVNDDYCDCFDGSDEPGTSACLNGVFYCMNAGHRPQNIPSSRVNDGICDCCDGSDEYASSATCSNICEELGREARAEALRLSELHKAGNQLRLELIEKGNKKRYEMTEQLSQLEKDKQEAEKLKAERESYKDDLESKENDALKVYREAEEQERQRKDEIEIENQTQEAIEYFNRYDSNKDGQLTKDELKVVNVFDKNKDGQVDDEESQYFLGNKDAVDKEEFISTTMSMIKPLLMMEKGMFQPADKDTDEEGDDQEAEHDADLDDSPHDGEDEDNVDIDLPQDDVEQTIETEQMSKKYDEETQRLVDDATEARRQFTDAERTVREIDSTIRNIQENLEKDYGPQNEYATLDAQCFEYEDKEYIYKLCLFQKVTQKSKNGGGEVGLGNWGEWAGQNNKYSVMKYTNGVACWNGPNRVTVVNIQCGMETKLLSVTEPFRCEYKIELSTPAACDESSPQQHPSHDEL